MVDTFSIMMSHLAASYSQSPFRFGYANSHSFALILVGLGAIVLIWVILLNWDYLIESVQFSGEQLDPLLEELGRIHRLSRSEMTLLQNAAAHLDLEHPAELFVDVSLWTPTEQTPFFSHIKMQQIRRNLFGDSAGNSTSV